jgi:hypothetical protein
MTIHLHHIRILGMKRLNQFYGLGNISNYIRVEYAVILSAAKNLSFPRTSEILRCAQDDGCK